MSTFANPLNAAAKALQVAQQALAAANEAKEAAANVFPYVLISGGSLLDEIVKHGGALQFSIVSAGQMSDMPSGISGGLGCEGFSISREHVAGDFGVFLWQSRDSSSGTCGRLWFRTIRDGAWTGAWKLVSTIDA